MYTGWVKGSDGEFYLQIADPEARFGFRIHDDDTTWEVIPGGMTLTAVKPEEVKKQRMDAMSWILDEMSKKYHVAFQTEAGGFDIVREFYAHSDREAESMAEEWYPGQEWYVLDDQHRNINGG